MDSSIAGLCKLLLCVLLTQFGKTFEAIKCINMQFDKDEEEGRSIHMVFTMNTLLNNSQFAKRLKEIQVDYGYNSVVVVASKYNGTLYKHVKSVRDLRGLCSNRTECPRVVVMCSNGCRFDEGLEFLKSVDSVEQLTFIKRCFVYYDELHKYINDKLRAQIEAVHALKCVREIIGLTATPLNIWQPAGVWNNIRIRYVSSYYDLDYCGYNDMIFRNIDFSFDTMPGYSKFGSPEANALTSRFVMGCIKRYPEILAEGSRVFIPGHVQKKNHFDIRARILKYKPETLVVVLDGQEKTLTYVKDGIEIPVDISSPDEEVCTTIYQKIKERHLEGRPLVITGFLCVGMGQTLTHHELGSFTSAIIGHDDLSLDDIYQLFGRITGRMKFWGDKYCKTVVYSPRSVMLRFKAGEYLAKNMAKNYNNAVACKKDYLAPLQFMGEAGMAAAKRVPTAKPVKAIKPKPYGAGPLPKNLYDYGFPEFETEGAAMDFWGKFAGANPNPLSKKNEQGFLLCSGTKGNEVLTYKKVRGLCEPEKGAAMSCHPNDIKPGQTVVRRYVCYKNNDASKPTFVIRWIKRL